MKRYDVANIEDTSEEFASCQGPHSALMVFRYFRPNEHMSMQRLYKEMGYVHKTWFFETYIARFFHQHGIPVMYYATEDISPVNGDPRHFREVCGMEYDDPSARDELDVENYDAAARYVKEHGLFEQRELSLEFVKQKLDEDRLVIASTNRNALEGKEGFKAHFLVIMGYEENSFICNDAYLGEGIRIAFERFSEAFFIGKNREADIVVAG